METKTHDLFEELDAASHVTLLRIYDVMHLILKNINPDDALMINKLHEAGHILAPPTAYIEDQNVIPKADKS